MNTNTPAQDSVASSAELVRCPLCGAGKGYVLRQGSTYRWWMVHCRSCDGIVAECDSDRRTTLGRGLPQRWPSADREWNSAGAYANKLRTLLEEFRRTCDLTSLPESLVDLVQETDKVLKIEQTKETKYDQK